MDNTPTVTFGQLTAVLSEIGYSQTDIETMIASKAVGVAR